MNSLDFFLACEWLSKNLPGSRVQKGIWISEEMGAVALELYSQTLGGKRILLAAKGTLGFLEGKPAEGMRTWTAGRALLGGRIVGRCGQTGFDRILRADFTDGTSLVAEVFDGNLLVLKDGVIRYCANQREWSGRKLLLGEKYLPPRGPAKSPGELSAADMAGRDVPLGRLLAVELGFGPEVSGVICEGAHVAKDGVRLSGAEAQAVVSEISRLFSRPPGSPPAAVPAAGGGGGAAERTAAEREKRKREKVERSIAESEKEAARLAAAGEAILSNLQAVDSAIASARAGAWKPGGIVKAVRKVEGKLVLALPKEPNR